MLNTLIKSRAFEKNFFWLRKSINLLNHRYNELHDINIVQRSSHLSNQKKAELITAKKNLKILKKACNPPQKTENSIPKKLWLYWNSPVDEAPEVVQVSIESWKKLNLDYEVILINDENINDILQFDFNSLFKLATINISYAHKADLLRFYLLSMYGGIWADTTTFCLKPLSSWVNDEVRNGFFTFYHKSNKTRPIEIWFIASSVSSLITRNTLKLFIEHLFKPRKHTLMVSNRIKKIGRQDNEKKQFYSDIIVQAETKGFMPYFSVSYFLNQVLSQPDTNHIWKELTNNTNKSVINNDSMIEFKKAYVSKQTYKKNYQETIFFKQRVAYIKSLF